MPVSNVVPPPVGLGAEPSSIDDKRVGTDMRSNVHFILEALLRLVIHNVTTMVCFHQRAAARGQRRENVMPDMIMESLNYLVEIAVHQQQMGFRALDRLAWCENTQHRIRCAGAE